jgi:hypothetical protein
MDILYTKECRLTCHIRQDQRGKCFARALPDLSMTFFDPWDGRNAQSERARRLIRHQMVRNRTKKRVSEQQKGAAEAAWGDCSLTLQNSGLSMVRCGMRLSAPQHPLLLMLHFPTSVGTPKGVIHDHLSD